MKKIVLGTFLTLDGVMQSPGNPQEDTDRAFALGGWQMSYFDADAGNILSESIASTDALLLGRLTYQIFAAFWPHAPEDDPIAHKLNTVPKYVVSTTLDKVEWNNSTLIKENVAAEVARLKQLPGEGVISITGSGRLAQSLMKEDLIDDYVLWFHPLVLRSGKRLFEEGVVPLNLKLVDTKTTSSGVVIATYRPANR